MKERVHNQRHRYMYKIHLLLDSARFTRFSRIKWHNGVQVVKSSDAMTKQSRFYRAANLMHDLWNGPTPWNIE